MDIIKRAAVTALVFVLVISGLQLLKTDESGQQKIAGIMDSVQERMEKAKESALAKKMAERYQYMAQMLKGEQETETENSEDGGIKYSPYTDAGANSAAEQSPSYQYNTGYIFMGDSRIYLMNQDCNIEGTSNFFVVCCPGIGYDWMIANGLPQIQTIEQSHTEIKNWVVISALGVNDMENVDKYVSTYNDLAQTMNLKLVSVNPTLGKADPKYNNGTIEAFNQRLQTVSGVQYINSYDYLTNKGYWMTDGLHYNEDSNWDIFGFMLNSLYTGTDSAPGTGNNYKETALALASRLSKTNN